MQSGRTFRDIVSVTHGYTSTHKNQSTADFTQTEVLNPRQGSQWVAHLLRTNHGHLLVPNRGYIEHTVPQPILDREMEAELFGMEHGDTITNAIEQAILFETISIDAMAANYSQPQWRYVPKTTTGIALREAGLKVTPRLLDATTLAVCHRIEAALANQENLAQ